jgi:phosphoglycerate dehydrogenase-like enzyme
MNIVLCYPVEENHRQQIAAAMPEANIIDAGQERIGEEILDADIYCGHAKVPVDWPAVVRQGRLKWIQSSAAGMDHCLVPSVVDSDIEVCSASGVLSDQVAEHTISLLTGWCRNMPAFYLAQRKKEYIRLPTRDLTRTTVGILGLGGVGRRLAQLLSPFGVRILGVDAFPVEKPDEVEQLWPVDRLDEMLAAVDFLVLCLPLNEITRGTVDAKFLAKMKAGAVLANMARGQLLMHDALIESLQSGHLAGAVLDVADPEPLPPESPLWEMKNVIITPHVAGQGAWRIDNMTNLFCRNLRRKQQGRPLINRLSDKKLGFPIRGEGTPLWGGVADD